MITEAAKEEKQAFIEFRALGLMRIGRGVEFGAQLAALNFQCFRPCSQPVGFGLAHLQESLEAIGTLIGGGQLQAAMHNSNRCRTLRILRNPLERLEFAFWAASYGSTLRRGVMGNKRLLIAGFLNDGS